MENSVVTRSLGAFSAVSTRHTSSTSLFDRRPAQLVAAVLIVVLACGGAIVPQAAAQDLNAELERLRRDLVDLQRFVYAGKPPASAGADAQGSSGAGGISSEVAGRLQVKLQQVDRQLRQMTGKFEEIEHRLRTYEEELKRRAADNELRFQRLEQGLGIASGVQGVGGGQAAVASPGQPSASLVQQPGAASSLVAGQAQSLTPLNQPASGQTGASGTTIVSSAGTTVQADGQGLAPGQQAFGTLTLDSTGRVVGAQVVPQTETGSAAQTVPQPAAESAPVAAPVAGSVASQTIASSGDAALPPGTPKEQYDHALTLLLRKKDYEGAETALKQFIDTHGGDPLAGNAMYWLGETYYYRENYRDAAAIFVDSFTNFPASGKASHSLLKLGMSLGALGKTDAACTAFVTLKEKYPQTEARVLRTADAEAARYGCS